jgi:hypothetical protein
MVRASTRFAALIRVDLTRRDALTGKVASPLAALVANLRNDNANRPSDEDAPVPLPVGLDLADIPEPEPPQPRGGRR